MQADNPYVLPVSLKPAEKKCLRVYANPTNLGKALLPGTFFFGNTFLLEPASCPTPAELAGYARQEVEYQGQ